VCLGDADQQNQPAVDVDGRYLEESLLDLKGEGECILDRRSELADSCIGPGAGSSPSPSPSPYSML
jgi:hypothetical protein